MAGAERSAARDVSPRSARLALAAIVVLALVLRVVYVLQSRANPYFDAPAMDALYHVEWARAWAHGQDFQPGPFFRAPGYPWFLGLVFRVFGEGLLAPRLVQAAIGAGSCALTYLVAARAFDRRTGLVAALLTATYWIVVYFDGELLLPVLEVPTSLLAILCALRWAERPSAQRAALAGLALGVAAVVRPNILLWAACVAVWMLLRGGPALRARAASALAFGLAALVPILPLTAYNALVGHDRALISTQAGVNLWIGNNPASDGSSAIAPGTRPDWWGGYHDTVAQAEAAEGRDLRPSEVSSHYTRRALRWMWEHPLDAARHLAWKLRLFWTDWELGNNQDEVFFALRFGPVLRGLPVGFGLVAPLALVGLALSARRLRGLGPAWLFVPAWCAGVVAFFVCARFRVPVLPVLCVFAAWTLVWALDRLRERAWRPLATAALAAALLALGVQAVPAAVDRTPAKGLWQLGVFAAQRGDWGEAEDLYRESIAANPRYAIAHQDLALALQAQGRVAEARALVAAAPLGSASHYVLGQALLADAILRDVPSPPDVEAEFARALELAQTPDEVFVAAFALGETLRGSGRFAAAVTAFERALAARPQPDDAGWFWRAQALRLRALTQAGEGDRARREARALLSAYPDDPRARSWLQAFLDG